MTEMKRNTKPLFSFANISFTVADGIKIIIVVCSATIAWEGIQSRLDAINTRLASLEATSTIYVRADVQKLNNESIDYKLTMIKDQIDRLEKKIDVNHVALSK